MPDRRRGWRRREVLARTNTIRRQHGLAPLKASRRLSAAARFHARDMARRRYFAHDTLGVAGHVPAVSWVARLLRFDRSPGGENIAFGQLTPAQVMAAWWDSPPHRENLLRPGFRRIGLARVLDSRGVPYWVQDFGY